MSGICYEFSRQGHCRYGDGCRFTHEGSPSAPVLSRVSLRTVGAINRDATRIRDFFAEYPSFNYSSSKPMKSEFSRMCRQFNWDSEDEEKEEAYQAFRIALTQQFNDFYGTDINDVVSWQNLCRRIAVEPIPEGLEECRDIVVETHVNLIDLVDNGSFEIFKSLHDLRVYTIVERKFFPLEVAYAGGLLKFLLREILNEYNGRRNKQSRGRPHRGGRRGARRGGPA